MENGLCVKGRSHTEPCAGGPLHHDGCTTRGRRRVVSKLRMLKVRLIVSVKKMYGDCCEAMRR